VAYRKIAEWIYPSLPPRVNDLPLPVKDKWGTPLANGLYYLVINKSDGRTILKMIVLK